MAQISSFPMCDRRVGGLVGYARPLAMLISRALLGGPWSALRRCGIKKSWKRSCRGWQRTRAGPSLRRRHFQRYLPQLPHWGTMSDNDHSRLTVPLRKAPNWSSI